jgi:hypothetical protein
VVLGQTAETFRENLKTMAAREEIPIYTFNPKERKDDIANCIRKKRRIRDGVVFIGVTQEKGHTFQGKKIDGPFLCTQDKAL